MAPAQIRSIASSSSAIARECGAQLEWFAEGEPLGARPGWTVQVHGRLHEATEAVRVVRDLHAAIAARCVAGPAVRGCPFVIGTAVCDERGLVVFSVARDLGAEGLVSLDDVSRDVERLRAYRDLPLEVRVAQTAELADAYADLEELRFVHRAFDGSTVMVRDRLRVPGSTPDAYVDAAIIGLDRGAVRRTRPGRVAEREQFAAVVHRSVFGVGPRASAAVRSEMVQLAEPLADALRAVSPLTGAQWADVLRAAGSPPEFRSLSVSRRGVIAGERVTVQWQAIPAREVHIDGVRGALPAEGDVDVVIRESGALRVVAVNAFGRTQVWTPTVRVFTPATVAAVHIPSVPPIVVHAPVVRAPMPEIDVAGEDLARAVADALRRHDHRFGVRTGGNSPHIPPRN